MPDSPKLLSLKHDLEIKQAMASKIDRQVHIPEDRSGRYDGLPLREMIVGFARDESAPIIERLPTKAPENEDGQSFDLLRAEVVEFCPMPLKRWQKWARHHLEMHRKQWIRELKQVKDALAGASMCAIPFGRFANADREGPEDWISPELKSASLNPAEAFENWTEVKNDGLTTAGILYFTRPYIIWPLEWPGALRHVTRIQGRSIYLERPSLHESFKMGPEVATADQAPPSRDPGHGQN